MNTDTEPSNLSRALWVFLGYMLVGPFFAGLAVAALMVLMPLLGLSDFLPADLPPLGVATTATFIWAAIPAALAAIIAIAVQMKTGTFGGMAAAVAGVLGFAVAIFITDFPFKEFLTPLAVLAGLISMAVREALRAGNIIT